MKRICAFVLAAFIICLSACSQQNELSSGSAASGAVSGAGTGSSEAPQNGQNSDIGDTSAEVTRESIVFSSEGGGKTVDAERIILEDCDILVPRDEWSFEASGASAIISSDLAIGVSLTLRVYEYTITDEAMTILAGESSEWAEWEHIENGGNSYILTAPDGDEGSVTYLVIEHGANSITMTCRYPKENAEGWAAMLQDVAKTLRIF